MPYMAIAVIYVAFACLIGFAMWFSGTAWPLFALILAPSLKWRDKD